MNQKIRASLSAVMDGEGDELELRRVLRALAKQPEEAAAWRRYHIASSVMRRERDIDVSVDLSAAIRARIDAQQPPAGQAARRTAHGPFSFMGNAAVAAAVSLMVITGVQVYRGAGQPPDEAAGFASSEASAQGSAPAFSNYPGAERFASIDATPVGYAGIQSSAGAMQVGTRGDALFPIFDGEQEGRPRVRPVQGLFDQHAQQADFQPQLQSQPQWSPHARFLGPAAGSSNAP